MGADTALTFPLVYHGVEGTLKCTLVKDDTDAIDGYFSSEIPGLAGAIETWIRDYMASQGR